MTRIGNSLHRKCSHFHTCSTLNFIVVTLLYLAVPAFAETYIELRKPQSAYSSSLTVSKGDTVTLEIWANVDTASAKGVEFFVNVHRGPFQVLDQNFQRNGLQPFSFSGGQFGSESNNTDSLLSEQIEWLNGAVTLSLDFVKTGVGLVATFKLLAISDTSASALINIEQDQTTLRDTRYQQPTPLPSRYFDSRRHVTVHVDIPTSIYEIKDAVQTYALHPNYPNPFNPRTTIRYEVPQAGPATLTVFNLLGQRVATLFEGRLNAGAYQAVWNGRNNAGQAMPSGMYIYRLEAGRFQQSRPMLLLK